MKKLMLIAAGVILLSGCTVRVADLTVASSKNYNLNSTKFVKGKRVTAEDSYPVILFPTGIPNVKTAIDRAIEQNRCAVGLTDMVVSQLNHAFIFGKIGVRVEGNLLLDRSVAGCENAS
ncbi:MAG TPA: hypothetical protein VH187_12130 [Scandinavium sp.]|jgi:hypothetical protein|uniref:hypothetical protein n=1 Tax=Scandinavium sp. TaxID=2830653 RepID=UPI002E36421A|nr:hypothetical protein [Scandinavium sp.]HEX4501882.1 hypothetical protein [Scandinavium sp.]